MPWGRVHPRHCLREVHIGDAESRKEKKTERLTPAGRFHAVCYKRAFRPRCPGITPTRRLAGATANSAPTTFTQGWGRLSKKLKANPAGTTHQACEGGTQRRLNSTSSHHNGGLTLGAGPWRICAQPAGSPRRRPSPEARSAARGAPHVTFTNNADPPNHRRKLMAALVMVNEPDPYISNPLQRHYDIDQVPVDKLGLYHRDRDCGKYDLDYTGSFDVFCEDITYKGVGRRREGMVYH
jgi:hypothetical protein